MFTRVVQALCILFLPLCWAPENPEVGDASLANRFFYKAFASTAYVLFALVAILIGLIVLAPWFGIFKHFFDGG